MHRIEGDRPADDFDESYEASALDGPDLDAPAAYTGQERVEDDDAALYEDEDLDDEDLDDEDLDDDAALYEDVDDEDVDDVDDEDEDEDVDDEDVDDRVVAGGYRTEDVDDEDLDDRVVAGGYRTEDADLEDLEDLDHEGDLDPAAAVARPEPSPRTREERPVGAPPEVGAYLPMLPDASTLGPRQARLAGQRRRRRTAAVALLSAGGVLLAVALLLPALTRGRGQTSAAATGEEPQSTAVAAGPVETRTLLLIGYGEEGGPARSTTLLTATSDGSAGSVVFLPPGLLLEIPGIGLDRLSQAQRFDGSDLVAETVETALGVSIDDFASLSEEGLASLLSRVGEFSVYVGDQPLVGREEEGVSPLRIEAGQQELSGEQMAVYFDLLAEGESPVDSFPRQQQVLSALLAKIAAEPEILDRVFTDGATDLAGNSDPAALREVLEALAAAQRNEQLAYETLPVEPFGGPSVGTVTTYRTEPGTTDFLDSLLPE